MSGGHCEASFSKDSVAKVCKDLQDFQASSFESIPFQYGL